MEKTFFERITYDNLELACNIQNKIFPEENGRQNFIEQIEKDPYRKELDYYIVYLNKEPIGITGIYSYHEYPENAWLGWFGILEQYRRRGYGTKVLLDTINYCKQLKKYDVFRVEVTYYEKRPALYLYDKVMQLKEEYTLEDTSASKTNTLIYSYSLKGKLDLWNNRYLGLREYYSSMKCKRSDKNE